jgi:hypothetical protein
VLGGAMKKFVARDLCTFGAVNLRNGVQNNAKIQLVCRSVRVFVSFPGSCCSHPDAQMYNGRLKNEFVPHRKQRFHFKDKSLSAVQAAIHEAHKYTLPRIPFSVVFAELRNTTMRFVMAIFPSASNISAPIGQILMNFNV